MSFAPAAARQLAALSSEIGRRIDSRILALADNPHPHGSEKIQGSGHLFRIRVGDSRVIYTVDEEPLLVLVLKIGHRGDVYRRL